MFIKHALICRWKFLQSLKESACILKKVSADFKGICMLITIYLNNAGSQRLISHSVAGQLSRWPPLEPRPLLGPSTLAMLPTRPPTKWFVWSLISGWDCRRRHRGIAVDVSVSEPGHWLWLWLWPGINRGIYRWHLSLGSGNNN